MKADSFLGAMAVGLIAAMIFGGWLVGALSGLLFLLLEHYLAFKK